MNKLKKKYLIIPLILVVISAIVLLVGNVLVKPTGSKLYLDFMKDLSNSKISTVYVTTSSKIKVQLKDNIIYETDNPRTDNFKEMLLEKGVKVSEQEPTSLMQVVPALVLIFSVVFILVYLIKNSALASKGLLSVDSLEANDAHETGFTFETVAGNEEAKESVKDVVDFLINPEKYIKYGARMPKGIILYGEPGTGKTLLAKAIAGEANVPFYAMSGSDFVQVYVGVGASRIRQLFKKAKSHGKAVIFIDEIDAIGKKRDNSKSGGSSDEKDQTLNALLTEMSGFNDSEGIIVLAATNRLDMLDSALLRPGRFDRHIEISLPDVSAREKILALHLKNKPVGDIKIHDWAQKTTGFSGAKLENLVNEAAILACKDNSNYIKDTQMDKAFSIVLAGHEKINRDYIKDNDKKITAYHEAGHALVSLSLLPSDKVSKVTIIPSTKGAGGYTLSIPQDQMYQNKDYLLKRVMVLLGGRAAEEIIFGKENITTGAYNDIKHCTEIVTTMATEYGMGETLGLLTMQEMISMNISVGSEIVNECKTLMNDLYEKVKVLLFEKRDLLEQITNELLLKETIYEEDINKLLLQN